MMMTIKVMMLRGRRRRRMMMIDFLKVLPSPRIPLVPPPLSHMK
jgi:hypothetical protein